MSGVAWVVMRQQHDGAGRYLVLVFPVVGVLLLAGATHTPLRRRRYGVPVFDPAGGFVVRFECVHRTVTGSGKNRSIRENVLWSGERIIPGATSEGEGVALPLTPEAPPRFAP